MYTATIIDKKILDQHEYILLTVELKSDIPITPKEKKEFVMANDGKPKIGKDGKSKERKAKKVKYPTKIIYFRYKIDTPFSEMKANIKKTIDGIESAESQEIPLNVPLDFSTP